MGSELSKRYDVDKDATGSGGHGYQWKSYQATRKKDGLEAVSYTHLTLPTILLV